MHRQYLLPVVHPAFELLKRSARVLHFIAASAILMNAVRSWQLPGSSALLCICQAIIAADIYIFVFFSKSILTESPRMNILFRLVESLTLLGIGITLAFSGETGFAFLYLVASIAYFFLMHREVRVIRAESVNIKHTGITVPDLLIDTELGWNEIRRIVPRYHGIMIETLRNRKIDLPFRHNLKIDELEQINDFCRQHLQTKQ